MFYVVVMFCRYVVLNLDDIMFHATSHSGEELCMFGHQLMIRVCGFEQNPAVKGEAFHSDLKQIGAIWQLKYKFYGNLMIAQQCSYSIQCQCPVQDLPVSLIVRKYIDLQIRMQSILNLDNFNLTHSVSPVSHKNYVFHKNVYGAQKRNSLNS